MKLTNKHRDFFGATTLFSLLVALVIGGIPAPLQAQRILNRFPPGGPMPMPPMNSDNNSSPSSAGAGGKGSGPWIPSEALGSTNSASSTNDIQLSFQGANIDMIVQWLAQTTGKSVIKSAQVQCQLTINSSKKMSPREALNLVYRALALEGYSVIEFNSSIMIVPQGKEPQMSPELLDSSSTNVPEGNQRLMKVFSLKHLQAADVKDRLSTVLSDKANVFVDDQVNQIIITDYNDNLRAASQLIAALDTDTPDDVTVRVLPLKNMSASDLMKEIGPLYQKNGGSNKDSVQITADQQSNALLILSSATNFKVIQQFVASLDTEGSQDKVMRTFSLVNADAQDVAKQLQDLNNSSSVTARYIYNFGGSDNSSNTKKMTVVADRRRNAVIIQAPPSQIDAIGKTIEELDAPVNDGSLAPKIYPMKFVSAADIEDVLNDLFLKKTQQQRPYWFDDEADTSTPDRDVGRLYGKVRITSEPFSNALIVTANSQENLMAVESIIKQLDQPSEAGESTLHVGLRFAKADTLANSINVLFAKNGSPPLRANPQQNQNNNQNNPQDQSQPNSQNASTQSSFDLGTETKLDGYYPWLGGQPDNTGSRSSSGDKGSVRPVSDLVGRVRAVADNRSNALLISANVHFFPQILKLIDELDAPADQVLIEARLVDVSSDFLDQLGVRYSPNGAQEFSGDDYDNSIIANVAANYVKGFGGNTTVNSPSSSAADIAQALTSLRSGVLSSSVSMDFLIQFLHRTTDATVLAEPQLNIRDNETGKLFVGQEVPIPANNQISSVGSTSTSISYKEVGVTLEVTPHINNTGDVELKIHAGSSTVVAGQTILGGAVFNTANFRTDLTAKDGQTLVLGGIIQKQISDTTRKTPWLGDIPGLGWAFKNRDKSSHETELMVFLRPHVIHKPEDAREILDNIGKQAPLVKKWYDDQHPNESKTNSVSK